MRINLIPNILVSSLNNSQSKKTFFQSPSKEHLSFHANYKWYVDTSNLCQTVKQIFSVQFDQLERRRRILIEQSGDLKSVAPFFRQKYADCLSEAEIYIQLVSNQLTSIPEAYILADFLCLNGDLLNNDHSFETFQAQRNKLLVLQLLLEDTKKVCKLVISSIDDEKEI